MNAPETDLQLAGRIDDAARVAALYRYQILDTPEEEAFDRIPRIVKSALNAPMAAIAFIDEDRRWFKSVAGGKRGNLPRHQSFCNTTIQCTQPTIVTNTLEDPQFCENPLVVDAPNIRAYLGIPLQTPDGYRIGSVCCVDKEPRIFSEDEIRMVSDLSSIVMEQLELRKLALFDPLTQVRSRRGFRTEVGMQLARMAEQKLPFSVLMLDIDHFKSINDKYGHLVGDEVLTSVCQRLEFTLDEQGIVGRMGGEEFAIAIPSAGPQSAMAIAERVRTTINAKPFPTSAGQIPLSVSIGSASSDQCHDLDSLLKNADQALYVAKSEGRNRVSLHLLGAA